MQDEQLKAAHHHALTLMAHVQRRYQEHLTGELAAVDLSVREHAVLGLLRSGLARTPGSLAKKSGVSRQLIHRVLARLEARKLLQRWQSSDSAIDVRVGLTPLGEAVFDESEVLVECFTSTLFKAFGAQHHAALTSLLQSLDALLDEPETRCVFVDD